MLGQHHHVGVLADLKGSLDVFLEGQVRAEPCVPDDRLRHGEGLTWAMAGAGHPLAGDCRIEPDHRSDRQDVAPERHEDAV